MNDPNELVIDRLLTQVVRLSNRQATTAQSWMVDGKPGAILAAMARAVAQASAVQKHESRSGGEVMTYRSAEDIRRAARIALAGTGIVTSWETSEEHHEDKARARVRVTVRFVAEDGSYIEHSVVNAAVAGQGRHFTVAITAAVKVLYGLALQLVTDDPSEDKVEEPAEQEWSQTVHLCVAAIEACANEQELAEVAKQNDAFARLTREEHAITRRIWARRREDLRNLQISGYVGDLRSRRRGD